ncbi:MAG: tautomerase family protein [Synergistaceae bacterium]|jgi:4-oxalocrotonate tautomerase|nr:tautomerase family protein [Synergistaceae bacterium]
MPRITIEILEGRTLDQKRALAKEACALACDCLHASRENVVIRIVEVSFENFSHNGDLRSDTAAREGRAVYGKRMEPRVTVQFLEGRTQGQLEAFVTGLTDRISEILFVEKADVKIFLLEILREEIAKGGVLLCDSK